MIKHVDQFTLAQLFSDIEPLAFEIPAYQRPYAWKENNWQHLFDDIVEGDEGHFLGTIICIPRDKPQAQSINRLDLVDGQQRITTIQLFYAALYTLLRAREDQLQGRDTFELYKLEDRLVARTSKEVDFHLVPQIHEDNKTIFETIVGSLAIDGLSRTGSVDGRRKLARAYKFFVKAVENTFDNYASELDAIRHIWKLLDKAILVKIEVKDHEAAYNLFESLNNRGEPLTAIDIIKNKALATVSQGDRDVEQSFRQWDNMLKGVGIEYTVQERFLRHHYHAFRERYYEKGMAPRATRSKLISIYGTIIDRDVNKILDELGASAKVYAQLLLNPKRDRNTDELEAALYNLDKSQGAPGYMLLLNLFTARDAKRLTDATLIEVVELVTNFFVRRNLTNTPPTYKLDQLFIDLVEALSEAEAEEVVRITRGDLQKASATDEQFAAALRGPVYETNIGATRYILSRLSQEMKTREMVGPWETDPNGKLIWTVEHVFPQGKPVPKPWVEMIADGDASRAETLREEYVHSLGNLTLTGYNSSLSNKDFLSKRDAVDKANKAFIGFRNGLGINEDIVDQTEWTIPLIQARTEALAGRAERLFTLHRSAS